MFVDLPSGQGRSQCARAPSLFRAFGEDLKPEFSSDFQRVDFRSSSGNKSLALWLTFVVDAKLVGLLSCDLTGALLLAPNC